MQEREWWSSSCVCRGWVFVWCYRFAEMFQSEGVKCTVYAYCWRGVFIYILTRLCVTWKVIFLIGGGETSSWFVHHQSVGLCGCDGRRGHTANGELHRKCTTKLNTMYNWAREHLTPTGVFIWASSRPVPFPSDYALRNDSAMQYSVITV